MTCRELIDWIHENNAEDLECVVQYRDCGWNYNVGEVMEGPALANYERNQDGHPYDVTIDYAYGLAKNCIVF